MIYRAKVEAVDGLRVKTGSKWLTCIGNKPVNVGDTILTDGRCVFGNYLYSQQSFVPIMPSKGPSTIPVLLRYAPSARSVSYAIAYFDDRAERIEILANEADIPNMTEQSLCNSRSSFFILQNPWRNIDAALGEISDPWNEYYHRSNTRSYTLRACYESPFEAVENIDADIDADGNLYIMNWLAKSSNWIGIVWEADYTFSPYIVSPTCGDGNILCNDRIISSYKEQILNFTAADEQLVAAFKTLDGWIHSNGNFTVFVYFFKSNQTSFFWHKYDSDTLYTVQLLMFSSDSVAILWTGRQRGLKNYETLPAAHSISIPMNDDWHFTFALAKTDNFDMFDRVIINNYNGKLTVPILTLCEIHFFKSDGTLAFSVQDDDASLFVLYRKINILPLSHQRFLILSNGNLFLFKDGTLHKESYDEGADEITGRFYGTRCVNHRLRRFNRFKAWRAEASRHSS